MSARSTVAKESDKKGRNVYKVNQWLWLFGRGKPCLGGLKLRSCEWLSCRKGLGVVKPKGGKTLRWLQLPSEARMNLGGQDLKIGYPKYDYCSPKV